MKLTELKNWENLTPEEKDRLREIYGEDPQIEKTLHDTNAESLEKAKKGGQNG
jgi:hypothetical protein